MGKGDENMTVRRLFVAIPLALRETDVLVRVGVVTGGVTKNADTSLE